MFREHRKHPLSVADLLPWGALVAPGVVANKDGSLLAGFEYWGPDLDSATENEIAAVQRAMNQALLGLGNDWMVHADAIRTPSTTYPAGGAFPDSVTALIDEESRAAYQTSGRNFETHLYLVFTWLPPDDRESLVQHLLLDNARTSAASGTVHLRTFEKRLEDLEGVLSSVFGICRLSSEALLGHLHSCLTRQQHPIAVPPTPCYLDVLLASESLLGGLEPRIGDHSLAILAITGFPPATTPALLYRLDQLAIPFRFSSRFLPLDTATAAAHIGRFRTRWANNRLSILQMIKEAVFPPNPATAQRDTFVNRHALAMAADADQALAEASQGAVAFGYYTPAVVLRAPDPGQLDESATELLKLIRHRGIAARRETFGAIDAFLGTLPGNGTNNVRRPLIHTQNLTHLLWTASVWAGQPTNPNPFLPPNSPAHVWAATGTTPFRLNLHRGDVGHTLIVGPTGSGKSTLVALLQAQFFRYPDAQVFAFDKGYSSLALALATGASHYDVAGDGAEGAGGQSLAFYPLAHIDEPQELLWALSWVEQLLVLQGLSLLPEERSLVQKALENLALSPERTLTLLLAKIQSNRLRTALRPYTLLGPYAGLFDGESDALRTSRYTVFEMSNLMGIDSKAVIPLLLYLFRRIEKRLDGRPTLIVLEEAWTFLAHSLFAERIAAWLRELRKLNAAVVFVTQSLADLHQSPLRQVLYESCPTKILLANPEATTEATAAFYTAIGCNERMLGVLAEATPKRHYYIFTPDGRRLIDLNLGPVALAFLGAGAQEHLRSIRDLAAIHGRLWPAEWLASRGLAQAAQRLSRLQETLP
jgi:type IV secretion system protein VirB4